jgi:hypothetical protein
MLQIHKGMFYKDAPQGLRREFTKVTFCKYFFSCICGDVGI